MMHQFLELNDGTQIVHSDVIDDETGKEFVEVYMEKPVKLGLSLRTVTCLRTSGIRWMVLMRKK